MKFQALFTLIILVLLFSHSYSQGETNGNTEGTPNGQANSTTNGQTNGTTNGETKGTTNGETNGQTVQPIQCLKKCEQLSYKTCTLCTQQCKNVSSGEVTSFKLTTCQIKQCKLWKPEPRSQQDPTNTQVICAELQTKLLSEQQCGPSCCDEQFQTFTYQNYEKCVSTNNEHSSSQTKTSVIIGAVLSSVLGSIIIFVLVICCRQRIALCCKNFVYAIQTFFMGDEFKKHRDPGSTEQSQHHQHNHQKNSKLKWETIQVKKQLSQLPTSKYIIESQYEINPQIYCSICLDSGLNTQTHCEHHFHLSCLRKKMAKKLICPECKSKDFNPLKISCDICMQKQAKFSIDKAYADYEIPDFFVNGKIYCDSCFKKNIQSGHIKQKSRQKLHQPIKAQV